MAANLIPGTTVEYAKRRGAFDFLINGDATKPLVKLGFRPATHIRAVTPSGHIWITAKPIQRSDELAREKANSETPDPTRNPVDVRPDDRHWRSYTNAAVAAVVESEIEKIWRDFDRDRAKRERLTKGGTITDPRNSTYSGKSIHPACNYRTGVFPDDIDRDTSKPHVKGNILNREAQERVSSPTRPPGCSCTPGCAGRGAPAFHKINGCQHCDCPISTRPAHAVEINDELTLADGRKFRVEFESHWSPLDKYGAHAHMALYGDHFSETGYRSHFGALGEVPEGYDIEKQSTYEPAELRAFWLSWILSNAEKIAAVRTRELSRGRGRKSAPETTPPPARRARRGSTNEPPTSIDEFLARRHSRVLPTERTAEPTKRASARRASTRQPVTLVNGERPKTGSPEWKRWVRALYREHTGQSMGNATTEKLNTLRAAGLI